MNPKATSLHPRITRQTDRVYDVHSRDGYLLGTIYKHSAGWGFLAHYGVRISPTNLDYARGVCKGLTLAGV